ncbi:hypothetical protein [Cellulomonas soli]|uniref:DUF2975 domain-containing protein n=1 Tax=Cellulomonas soli TaxID=931535 RepID=A0A512PI39_9CELL|nr:hypothetical protein [Cellulomonas soli]NYI58750.1 hypothetical protein [Cellulomonas soli]GEP70870.1 hypothetical protein CSO01_35850 [Cellulomonas soli]
MSVVPQVRTARRIRRLAGGLVVLGVLAAVWGVAYTVNAATQAPATVRVPVAVHEAENGGWGDVRVGLDGVQVPDGWLTGARPSGYYPSTVDSTLTLAAWGSTRTEQALSRADWLVTGLGLLAGTLLLQPVLLAVAAGEPFARGNARLLTVLAGVVAVTGTLAPLPPALASTLVLARTGLDANPALSASSGITPAPLLVAALVLVVAVAFRAGERLARDTEGLV